MNESDFRRESDAALERLNRSLDAVAEKYDAEVMLQNSVLTIEIELPANHGFGQKCIHCQGTVTRVMQAEPDCPRVALRVNYMDFRAFHDRLRSIETQQPVRNTWMA